MSPWRSVLAFAIPMLCVMPLGASASANREDFSFSLVLDGPLETVFPLFGPIRESEWAPEFKAHLVSPTDPDQIGPGTVFLAQSAAGEGVWILTDYDLATGTIRYVFVVSGSNATEINIRLAPIDKASTRAQVTYRRTALSAKGRDDLSEWAARFPAHAPGWQERINRRLDAMRAVAK